MSGKIGLIIVALFMIVHCSYSGMVWSSLYVEVVNQYGEPLRNAEIYMDCQGSSNPFYCTGMVTEEDMCYMGRTDDDGTLLTICNACREGTDVRIIAKYKTASGEAVVKNWKGYGYRFDSLGVEGCYDRKPVNRVPKLIVNTSCLEARFFDGIFPIENQEVYFSENGNWPQLVKTDEDGKITLCKLTAGQNISFYAQVGGVFTQEKFLKTVEMPDENTTIDIEFPPSSELVVACKIRDVLASKDVPSDRNMTLIIRDAGINVSEFSPMFQERHIAVTLPSGYYNINFVCNNASFEEEVMVRGTTELVFYINKTEGDEIEGTGDWSGLGEEGEMEIEYEGGGDYGDFLNESAYHVTVTVCAFDRLKRPIKDVEIYIVPKTIGYESLKRRTEETGCVKIFLFAEVEHPVKYSLTAKYKNGIIGHKTFMADGNKKFNFTAMWVACEDGAMNGRCSKTKPYVCIMGKLKEDCVKCRCPNVNEVCDSVSWSVTKKCCPNYQIWNGTECINRSKAFRIYYYPINYNISAYGGISQFGKIVNRFTDHLIEEDVGLSRSDFYIVNDSLFLEDSDYTRHIANVEIPGSATILGNLILWYIDDSFKDWYKKHIGYGKDPDKEQYRVAGMDYREDPNTDTIGFTKFFKNAIYISIINSYKSKHTLAHELGHTFGLCDQYHPDLWSQQNAYLFLSLHGGCKNDKPTSENSECDEFKCPLILVNPVCCYGIKIDDETYSTMGSADTEKKQTIIRRRYTNKEKEEIRNGIMHVIGG